MSRPFLPDEAKAVIWQIFGEGESPLKKKSTFDLIIPIVKKHTCSTDQDWAISEIRGWFESHGDHKCLKYDKNKPVAIMILEGIRNERGETAIWAVGSIEADLAARTIRSLWSVAEIDSFVECTLKTLEKLCDRDQVLDAGRMAGFNSVNANIRRNSLEREGRLKTFRLLDSCGFKLVHQSLYHGAGNLIDLVVNLRPEIFASLIERLDHSVVQTRAAQRMISTTRRLDHRKSLQWIGKNSCDAMIALGIVHTLNTVNTLDEDLRHFNHGDDVQRMFSAELCPPHDDLDTAAAGLLTGLVDRLTELDPLVSARWIGELLSDAPYVLPRDGESEIPRRIEQLETACTNLLARLVRQSWSDYLLAELRAGLCLTPRKTWTRHIIEIAWAIREADPMRATQIASATLKEHERYVAEQLECNHLFLNWSDWHHRQWFTGLGIAIVLSQKELDLPGWTSKQCRTLSLSVWDAEENYEAFSTADRVVQHWFLVALHAIPALVALDRKLDPSGVRALAEMLWAHYEFAGQYLHHHSETLMVAEHAARSAVEFGEPSDTWLLDQARHPGVEPRVLWALIDQRQKKCAREGRADAQYHEMIAAEFISIASDRYRTSSQFDLEALNYWGQLWLLLDAVDEAEQTAVAIISFNPNFHDRASSILALKLFAMIANTKKLAPITAEYTASLYDQLWSSYTPHEEHADRQQIDEKLKRSMFSVL